MSSEAGRGTGAAGEAVGRDARHRPRLRSLLLWLLFHRSQLLSAVGFVAFPWFARGLGASLLANLFVLGFGEQVAVAALATVAGQVLVIVTWTSTRAGPLRLWPGMGDELPEQALRLGYREFRHAFRRTGSTSSAGSAGRPAVRAPGVANGSAGRCGRELPETFALLLRCLQTRREPCARELRWVSVC